MSETDHYGYSVTDLNLTNHLTDGGKYAYGIVCSNILKELYFNDYKTFYLQTFDFILKQLTLPLKMEESIRKTHLNEKVSLSIEPYIDLLSEEKVLKNRMELLVKDLIYLSLLNGEYDARWRVFIKTVAKAVNASEHLEDCEASVVHLILNGDRELSEEEKKLMKRRAFIKKTKRYAVIAAITAGGGALIGLTGGMAAPVLVESLALVAGSSALVASLSGTVGTAVITSLFGGVGASLVGYKIIKRKGGLSEFKFGQLFDGGIENSDQIPLVEKTELSITIAISGWVDSLDDGNFSKPWRRLSISREQYFLRYESNHLYEVGKTMDAPSQSLSSFAGNFSFPLLFKLARQAILPVTLMSLTSVVDLPWSVGCSKAIVAGEQLADVLILRKYGRRPVTLIGYSLGARVIYYCLLELSQRKDVEGIIEDVYLIGAPCPADPEKWTQFTKLVGGTITNGFSMKDNWLKYLHKMLSLPGGGIAGAKPIEVNHKRFRNVDLSHIISGHSEYPLKINTVLKEMKVNLIN